MAGFGSYNKVVMDFNREYGNHMTHTHTTSLPNLLTNQKRLDVLHGCHRSTIFGSPKEHLSKWYFLSVIKNIFKV